MINELKRKYYSGEVVLASELNNNGGRKLFGEYIFPAWKQDKATAQGHLLDNDVSWKRIVTPSTVLNVHELNRFLYEMIPVPTDEEKLTLVRHQLRIAMGANQ